MVITSPALLQKLPLHKKPHGLQLPKLRQPQTIILSCAFDLIFFLSLCRLSKTDPMQKPRRYRQLPLNAYPDMAPTLNHTAREHRCSPTAPNTIRLTVTFLPAEKFLFLLGTRHSDYQAWERLDTPLTWKFQKRFGCIFLFPSSLIQQESAILQKPFAFSQRSHFSYQRGVRAKTREPRHVRGNSSLQLVLEKHQAVISYLFIGRMLLPVSEQLQKDQDLVLKEL